MPLRMAGWLGTLGSVAGHIGVCVHFLFLSQVLCVWWADEAHWPKAERLQGTTFNASAMSACKCSVQKGIYTVAFEGVCGSVVESA